MGGRAERACAKLARFAADYGLNSNIVLGPKVPKPDFSGNDRCWREGYRVIRPWLTSTFDELIVYCRTTLLLSKKNHERLLIAFSAAMNQAHIGNKVRGLRVHSGEIVFPYFVAAISEGGLCRVAI
jgi:hypothetical protein